MRRSRPLQVVEGELQERTRRGSRMRRVNYDCGVGAVEHLDE